MCRLCCRVFSALRWRSCSTGILKESRALKLPSLILSPFTLQRKRRSTSGLLLLWPMISRSLSQSLLFENVSICFGVDLLISDASGLTVLLHSVIVIKDFCNFCSFQCLLSKTFAIFVVSDFLKYCYTKLQLCKYLSIN